MQRGRVASRRLIQVPSWPADAGDGSDRGDSAQRERLPLSEVARLAPEGGPAPSTRGGRARRLKSTLTVTTVAVTNDKMEAERWHRRSRHRGLEARTIPPTRGSIRSTAAAAGDRACPAGPYNTTQWVGAPSTARAQGPHRALPGGAPPAAATSLPISQDRGLHLRAIRDALRRSASPAVSGGRSASGRRLRQPSSEETPLRADRGGAPPAPGDQTGAFRRHTGAGRLARHQGGRLAAGLPGPRPQSPRHRSPATPVWTSGRRRTAALIRHSVAAPPRSSSSTSRSAAASLPSSLRRRRSRRGSRCCGHSVPRRCGWSFARRCRTRLCALRMEKGADPVPRRKRDGLRARVCSSALAGEPEGVSRMVLRGMLVWHRLPPRDVTRGPSRPTACTYCSSTSDATVWTRPQGRRGSA